MTSPGSPHPSTPPSAPTGLRRSQPREMFTVLDNSTTLEPTTVNGRSGTDGQLEQARARWTDPTLPVAERVAELMSVMTVEEKLAQLVGAWVGMPDAGLDVAPDQHSFTGTLPPRDVLLRNGLGQLTRIFGTFPLEPAEGVRQLAELQQDLLDRCRLRIPAVAHEECLSGFTAWKATVFPIPLAWAASFDPNTVLAMATAIGTSMHEVGIHQGLAPVLDVCRDPRWGRTEETLGEDPYLVGIMGSAYVRGLESAGIVATLKHFAGYSGSRGARNHAPVPMGPREFADLVLVPFEMALRLGGARSVMHSYAEVDGVPPAADHALLTDLLREQWGFTGTVVADYFGVSFLETAHHVADSPGTAAAMALAAGVDVELPSVNCYGEPLLRLVREGVVDEALVDRALERVLRQKCVLGLLDADWTAVPQLSSPIDLDPPEHRELAARLAERSVVLLDNPTGLLPLPAPDSVAVVGPCATELLSLMGCYAFPSHVGSQYPEVPLGVNMPNLLDAVRGEWPGATVSHAVGVPVQDDDPSGIAEAVAAARAAQVCLVAVGDQSGLFGRGTSGEGCDAADLKLPGLQHDLIEALLATGVPVVLVVLSGRPYALGAFAGRAAAIVQAFMPGQLGAQAVTGVLSGRVNPSGRLPVQVPKDPASQPTTYLHPPLGGPTSASSIDPSPLYPFGFGLSYTTFEYSDLSLSASEIPTDGTVEISATVTNTGPIDGAEVVQLYVHDVVGSVTRPVRELAGFLRVGLPAGASRRVRFTVHADRFSFTGTDLRRVVEPGTVEVGVGGSSADTPLTASLALVGPARIVGHERVLLTPAAVD